MAANQPVISVVGARPQFVKLAPICQAFDSAASLPHRIVHTGQHYDPGMSTVFFEELSIPSPDVNLNVGSGGHGEQTGKMLGALEACFIDENPAAVVIYGDTNSTLAACLAAVKLHIPVVHVEAGLRSFNRAMPEEINRIASDHCSDRLYAPTPVSLANLQNENLLERSVLCGDVMRDTVIRNLAIAEQKGAGLNDIPADYGVLTLHRPVNTDGEFLPELLSRIDRVAGQTVPLIFPVHPRIQSIVKELCAGFTAIEVVDPLAYLDMLVTVRNARLVITDSGGLQKEAAFVATPCVTIREETEWTETVEIGVNRLTGTSEGEISDAVFAALDTRFSSETTAALNQSFGDGNAAQNIVQDLIDFL